MNDMDRTGALLFATEALKWFLLGFMAGVLACFLLAVLA